MKHFQKLLAVLLCFSIVFSLAACQTELPDSTTNSATGDTSPDSIPDPDLPTAAERYDSAKAAVDDLPALEITFTVNETMTFRSERYERSSTQTVTLTGRGTEDLRVCSSESITQGQTAFTAKEYYDGATVYMDIKDTLYRTDMTAEDYLRRLLPVALLDSALYGEITAEGNTLTFCDPTAGESWAIYETAVLTDATGTATLSDDGALTSTSYTASYRYGAVGMELCVKAAITIPESIDISANAPEEPAAYTSLRYIDAPKLIELSGAMIKDTNTASAVIDQYMYSDLTGRELTGNAAAYSFGTVDNLMAKITLDSELSDADGVIHTESDSATFRDGECTDGFSTAEEMKGYCLMYMTQHFPDSTRLTKAKLVDTGAMYLLEMEADDSFAQTVYDYLRENLFPDDPEYLDDQSSEYSVRKMDITLSIDRYTGFPVCFSFEFEGRHTIDDEKYKVYYDFKTTYELGSNGVYEAITGEQPQDEEPENKATPLFYHVTGKHGEEMWLLGTIHVGDSRTAYLPQEIYDAFNASDALAVEVDVIAFQEQMQTDKKLQTQISVSSCYISGTTLKDHVDRAVYDATVDFATAMGIYNDTLVYYKAGFLYSYITGYFDRYIPDYYSEKGVDYRFLTMAKNQSKPILSIENGLDQMRMFTTCSKKLQEYLLAGSLSSDAAEYHDGTMELFEAWCRGDEAQLRQLVTTDTSNMTEEERTLYEEYRKIMEADRNAHMLQKAIEYMESGDVVFYAVGAAHVMAQDGLVNTLRDAGYTVEAVSYIP